MRFSTLCKWVAAYLVAGYLMAALALALWGAFKFSTH